MRSFSNGEPSMVRGINYVPHDRSGYPASQVADYRGQPAQYGPPAWPAANQVTAMRAVDYAPHPSYEPGVRQTAMPALSYVSHPSYEPLQRTIKSRDIDLGFGDVQSMGAKRAGLEVLDHEDLLGQAYPFPESIYGAGMVGLIRTLGKHNRKIISASNRNTGIVFFILILTIVLQTYVLYAVKTYLSAPAVIGVRELYEEFEQAVIVNGVFSQENFDNWDESKIEEVCQIPLSHPLFFMAILVVWSSFVLKDITETMAYTNCWFMLPPPDTEEDHVLVCIEDGAVQLLRASSFLKSLVFVLILVPKMIVALVVWWLGARWLTATVDLQEVLVNTVALAFILDLDEVLYHALLPFETKMKSMLYTIHRPPIESKLYKTGVMVVNVSIILLAPILYMKFFQQVIPNYHWDLSGPCHELLHGLLKKHGLSW